MAAEPKQKYQQALVIKSWAEEDRPREKLLLKGKAALSDAELIAILIGSGTPKMTAVDLAKSILGKVGNDLHALAALSVEALCKEPGIGPAKAIAIVSALELGRRRKEALTPRKTKITCSQDIFDYIRPHLLDLPHEEFWVILLNRANEVMKKMSVSKGGVAGTVADPKVIFKLALDHLASALVLVHNHPSGNLKPSSADVALTRKMKEAGELLDLPILDHVIFAQTSYYSFADEGAL
ncbi:MAG: RadC family protein [Adhaeribacter sp.]